MLMMMSQKYEAAFFPGLFGIYFVLCENTYLSLICPVFRPLIEINQGHQALARECGRSFILSMLHADCLLIYHSILRRCRARIDRWLYQLPCPTPPSMSTAVTSQRQSTTTSFHHDTEYTVVFHTTSQRIGAEEYGLNHFVLRNETLCEVDGIGRLFPPKADGALVDLPLVLCMICWDFFAKERILHSRSTIYIVFL